MSDERHFHIAAREDITVPAGTFNAFRIEGTGGIRGLLARATWKETYWFAPDVVRVPVARKLQAAVLNQYFRAEHVELVQYKQA